MRKSILIILAMVLLVMGIANANTNETEEGSSISGNINQEPVVCDNSLPFKERLFSACKSPNNGICDDGESVFDADCKNNTFSSMGFIRLILLLSVVFLAMNSSMLLYVAIFLLIILMRNGAFAIGG